MYVGTYSGLMYEYIVRVLVPRLDSTVTGTRPGIGGEGPDAKSTHPSHLPGWYGTCWAGAVITDERSFARRTCHRSRILAGARRGNTSLVPSDFKFLPKQLAPTYLLITIQGLLISRHQLLT